MTRYVYDEQGRMTGSAAEPEWDEQQQGWMLALAHLEGDVCPGCSGWISETTAQDQWGRAQFAYEVARPTRCNRCTALSQAQKDAKDLPHQHALLWSTHETKRGD